MPEPSLPRLTTELLWRATLILSLPATAGLLLAARLAPPRRFAELRRWLAAATFTVWFTIWTVMVLVYWEAVYAYVFPAWLRWPLPLLMGAGYAEAAWLLWRLARRFRRPAVTFVLGGAALGPLTHLWAVARGIVSRPPMLQGASPVAAVVVSAPEFALYFALIMALAALGARMGKGGSDRPGAGRRA